MHIQRSAKTFFDRYIKKKKVLILYGPRRAGKTTLLHTLFAQKPGTLFLSCDEERIRRELIPDQLVLRELVGSNKTMILDEAQQLDQTGLVLKVLVDNFPHLNSIASGSSSFELAHKVQEPLTGRYLSYTLFPLTIQEFTQHFPSTEHQHFLDHALLYGTYPELFSISGTTEKIRALTTLTDAYLYKDILSFQLIKSSRKLRELLELLALQIGNDVSYSELGTQLGMDAKTVERYIDLLEKSFVLFRLHGYSRNLRSSIRRKVKIYFVDLGIRNAIINTFTELHLRSDKGALLENLFISDYWKRNHNVAQRENLYFWRTYDQKELDFLAEKNGTFRAFEVKWQQGKSSRHFAAFKKHIPKSSLTMVDRGNILSVCGEEPLS